MTFYKGFFYCLALLLLIACSGKVEETKDTSQKIPSPNKIITSQHLFGVGAFGKTHVWIVGFEGTILHSSDGGDTWTPQKAPNTTDFYDAFFTDIQTGWIVGKFGTILHTTDGGQTWSTQESGTNQRLFALHFTDSKTGWAVGVMGTILHTEDAGETWTNQGFGEDRYYNDVFFVDDKRGWVVGEYATMYHTEDGGKSWVPQACEDITPEEPEDDFPPPPPHLYSVHFKDANRGWISGMDGIILRTEDGGNNWKQLETNTVRTLFQIAVVKNSGWSIGERGLYYESRDGGTTWKRVKDKIRTRFWLRGMEFIDEKHGWIVGAFGTILHTIDGGTTWEMLSGISIQ